jgi:hypothetical protein
VNVSLLSEQRSDLIAITSQYDENDIYNFDETAHFFRLQPNATLASHALAGTKIDKNRLTIGVCTNATGTDKCRLVMIGKYERPRCFGKTFNSNSIVRYFWNKKAWMTIDLFSKWLLEFDKKFIRKVLLLVDNAAGHSISDETKSKLKWVQLHFLPPNTTSFLQPCDAGIIKCLKQHYKKLLVNHYLESIENESQIKEVDVKQAMVMINKAWKEVSESTIRNCWRHCKILGQKQDPIVDIAPNQLQISDSTVSRSTFDRLLKFCHPNSKLDSKFMMNAFLNHEEGVPTGEILREEDIIAIVIGPTNED